LGYETTTFGLALALVARTDQAVFGPVLGAIEYLRAGTVRKLEVENWRLTDELFLAYNTAHITSAEQRSLVAALEQGVIEAERITSR
jgi:hypothetical protein